MRIPIFHDKFSSLSYRCEAKKYMGFLIEFLHCKQSLNVVSYNHKKYNNDKIFYELNS